MTNQNQASSQLVYMRSAGWLYLLIIVFGITSEMLVRSPLIVFSDPVVTAGNIVRSEGLFRFGFLADSIMLLCDVALAVIFYVLLKPVNKTLSLLAAAFRLTQAVILSVNLLLYYAALLLLNNEYHFSVFSNEQINALSLLLLEMHSHGYDLGLIFFSVANFILGYLIIKSKFIPGVLGYGLLAVALAYLAGSYTRFLLPAYSDSIQPIYLVPFITELALCVWLLTKGIGKSKGSE
tara:strand:- start:27 stop:734 length:708 start_codon:yes stop_codon:yes gene_type:complete